MLHTYLFHAPSPNGSWSPSNKNYNFFQQDGWSRFPRIWGYPYTGDPELMLVTHQQCNFWRSYYIGACSDTATLSCVRIATREYLCVHVCVHVCVQICVDVCLNPFSCSHIGREMNATGASQVW
jgi:hypothetical protein